ncbi:hypothetical protein KE3_1327 [Streptococcus lutetiensis 033]|uniref:Uncharacterized protein n=1 Tax=Streptococcus lutetiensis 033 TaxID=1076934 RepID=A0AB33AMN3_9STRE|nr:hypothetical protein KE3_1327 [Streptococcus lutetiensis 033]
MVPKRDVVQIVSSVSFRAVLFRMVPKQHFFKHVSFFSFRAVLFRMVPKHVAVAN